MNRLLIASLPLLLAACATSPGGPSASGPAPTLSYTPVLTKLDSPWDMAFLPNGTMFFTEKCLGLSVRQPSGTVVKLLGMKDAKGYGTTANDLFCEGQAGMAGVAVDPNFASNRFVYVYSTSSLTAPGTNRVIRLKVNDAMTAKNVAFSSVGAFLAIQASIGIIAMMIDMTPEGRCATEA